MEAFLLQLFIYLAAAAISVPVAKKLGLGSVLGYLIAGIIIGPFGISLIHDIEAVMHFTEFGVVMMLFLVGLELRPSLLWQLRLPILGTGGTQVIATAAAIMAIAAIFLPWQQALATGLILSLSSTAIVLQTLQEKGRMDTEAGRSVFSVLLFQDLAVIPMLAGIPLLATLLVPGSDQHQSVLFDLSTLPDYQRVLATTAAIAAVLLLGKFASRPVFRAIAATGVREIFVAAALGLVIGTSLLMLTVGLSPALGAFLAGVVLADSEFRHELESDIEPFKGLLLGIFFISIGASLNFSLISNQLILILTLTAGLIGVKWLMLAITGYLFKISKPERSLFAIALAQGGEFAFVLFQLTKTTGVLPPDVIDPLISAVAISMFLAPVLFLLHDKITQRRSNETPDQATDTIDTSGHKVILAGFGRLGTDVGRILLSAGMKPVIVDNDISNVTVLRKLGFEVYFGDITRPELLKSAGASEAELLIITIGDTEKTSRLIELTHKYYPHLKTVVSASHRKAAFDLMTLGVRHIHRETFGTALALSQDALIQLGKEPYEARRLMHIFRKKDEQMMPELLTTSQKSESSYISVYQQHHAELETLMRLDTKYHTEEVDQAWTARNPEQ